jgi:hypothetical protein
MKKSWQMISDSVKETTDRLKVPGGWLYRTRTRCVDYNGTKEHIRVLFIPNAPKKSGNGRS